MVRMAFLLISLEPAGNVRAAQSVEPDRVREGAAGHGRLFAASTTCTTRVSAAHRGPAATGDLRAARSRRPLALRVEPPVAALRLVWLRIAGMGRGRQRRARSTGAGAARSRDPHAAGRAASRRLSRHGATLERPPSWRRCSRRRPQRCVTNARVSATSASRHCRTSSTRTYSSALCRPAPPGPNSTAGIPAAPRMAASVQ